MVSQEKAAFTEFYGRADTWGAVIRTIKASSGSFTSMTTIGHRIAAACDDGTVGFYDSITGALRLSLSPTDPVQTIKGSPDGSMLFCAHRGPSVTAWDIQTGGLVHTLTLNGEVREIAICLEGRYIACGLSDGTVRIWEVSGKAEGAAFGSGSPISHLCWLESGKQLVVVQEASVQVWDVVARQVLRSSTKQGPICGVVYAQKLNKFVTVATSGAGSIVTVVDPRTGTSFANRTEQQISCFAFSQVTKELVCGMSTSGIELFSIQARDWRQFNHPAAITSISTLSSGTIVANVTGSGIQLLSLDERYTPPQQETLSALTVHALDRGNIIVVSSTNPNQVALLESSTMSPLLTICVPPDDDIDNNIDDIPINRPTIFCASLQHRVAVDHTESAYGTRLRLWRFGKGNPEWVDVTRRCRVVGGFSPSGSRLVVLHEHEVNRTIHVRIWDIQNGKLQVHQQITTAHPHVQPLGVEFKSEERFYSQHDTYRILYVIVSSKPAASSDPDATLQPDTPSDISFELDASVRSDALVMFEKHLLKDQKKFKARLEKVPLEFEKARLEFEKARLEFAKARLGKAQSEAWWMSGEAQLEKAQSEKAQLEKAQLELDKARLEKARLELEKAQLEFRKAQLEFQKAQLELEKAPSEKARLELEKARLELEKAQLELEKARLKTQLELGKAPSEKARLELKKAHLEFQEARLELEKAWLGFQKARLELEKAPSEKARLELGEAQLELEKARLEFEKARLEKALLDKALSRVPGGLTIRFKKLALASGQLGRYYNLDDTREWVTCPTKRICWIPPGYIGSDNDGHCWVGNVLFMAGHDGALRRLIFREPLEGQEKGVQADFS